MIFWVLVCVCFCGCFADVQYPTPLRVHNWTEILTGEWMVEFYAAWCPACQLVAPEWQQFSQKSHTLGINVATIDCSLEPAVATIFTITALPTIYHVKDGVFRAVKGKRKCDELTQFIQNREYELIEPTTWSYSPSAFYMPAIVRFINLSLSVNTAHKALTKFGIPSFLSLMIVGTGVLASGAAIGLAILGICEYFCPPRPQILNVLGMEAEPPEPLITKANDNDEDSVLNDSGDDEEKKKEGSGEDCAASSSPSSSTGTGNSPKPRRRRPYKK